MTPPDEIIAPPLPDALVDHTDVCEVRDRRFAAALLAIGAEYLDPNDPFTLLQRADGRLMEFWRLRRMTRGGIDLKPLLVAQLDPEKWVMANSGHPLAFALCAEINHRVQTAAVEQSRPMVGFRLPGDKCIFVFRDARKHRKLAALAAAHPGVTQI